MSAGALARWTRGRGRASTQAAAARPVEGPGTRPAGTPAQSRHTTTTDPNGTSRRPARTGPSTSGAAYSDAHGHANRVPVTVNGRDYWDVNRPAWATLIIGTLTRPDGSPMPAWVPPHRP